METLSSLCAYLGELTLVLCLTVPLGVRKKEGECKGGAVWAPTKAGVTRTMRVQRVRSYDLACALFFL